MHRKLRDLLGEAAVLEGIGDARILQAEHQRAAACFQRSAELCERLGKLCYQAEATTRLGAAQQASGNLADGRRAWNAVPAILEVAVTGGGQRLDSRPRPDGRAGADRPGISPAA
jgi:hypothetical protein